VKSGFPLVNGNIGSGEGGESITELWKGIDAVEK
jgi:hypothetical protein